MLLHDMSMAPLAVHNVLFGKPTLFQPLGREKSVESSSLWQPDWTTDKLLVMFRIIPDPA